MKAEIYHRLGELLVARGKITDRQLQVALAEQKKGKRRLGDILVGRGYADEMDIAQCLADQYGHPPVDLRGVAVDPSVAAALSPENAVALRALPFARTQDGFAVAIADPVDPATTDLLYSLLRTRLELFIAPIGALSRHIRFVYGLSDEAPGLTAPEATKAPKRFAHVRLRMRFEDAALFDGHDTFLDRNVSLICRSKSATSAEMTEIIQAAAGTCNPVIAAIHDYCEDKTLSWTVLEPLPADNLGRVLKVRGPRPLAEAAELVATIASAIEEVGAAGRHDAWACPDNIFLGDHGPVLAPVGPLPAAYRVDANSVAPTVRDAVHSLGVLLEACLVKPYSDEAEELPFQMQEILFRALGTETEDLFEAPGELAETLRSYAWTITKPSATTTMEERNALLDSMEEISSDPPKPSFWDRLFGRTAA